MTVTDVQVEESARLREELARIARQLTAIAEDLERLAAASPNRGEARHDQ